MLVTHSATEIADVDINGTHVLVTGSLFLQFSLNLPYHPRITDATIEAIGKGCPNIRSFHLSKCAFVSKNGNANLAVFGRLCPQLKHVELTGLEAIIDAGLLPMLESSEAGLVKVNLSGCLNLIESNHVLGQFTWLDS
ncbi:Transcription factor COE2 [Stylosanthes scabra]|uniref:Transcription factor COE2 n=1 Tax=Stylosanthes scabra TaxID=79078 RepID=A0ABU6Q9W5_9FABA|nr:Transcription factor COE2 [Stylosanthes scabra]